MSAQSRLLSLSASIVIGGLVLAGCSSAAAPSDQNSAASQPPSNPTTSAPASSAPAVDPAEFDQPIEKSVNTGALTKPGATLAVGATAVVVEDGKVDGSDEQVFSRAYDLTVKSITKAGANDLKNVELTGKAVGMQAHYLKFSFKKNSGDAHTSAAFPSVSQIGSSPTFTVETSDGSDASGLNIFGTFKKCDDGSSLTLKQYDEGKTFSSCLIFMLDKGVTAKEVKYYGDSSSPYDQNPITFSNE